MMSIQTLIAAGIGPTQAKLFVDPLNSAAQYWGIDSAVRWAMFIAQCGHESEDFVHLEENCYYSAPERIQTIFRSHVHDLETAQRLAKNPQALANCVYAGRNGNGDEESGDGWKYRGRGLIQLTGRANYADAPPPDGFPSYEDSPDLVATPLHAAWTAASFFARRGCLVLADASNVEAVTKLINGPAMLGLDDRRNRFNRAVRAFL